MLLQATKNAVADHMWPAGHY